MQATLILSSRMVEHEIIMISSYIKAARTHFKILLIHQDLVLFNIPLQEESLSAILVIVNNASGFFFITDRKFNISI